MNKLSCGCIPDASGYGYCSECTKALRKIIWKNMSSEKRNYDYVDRMRKINYGKK